MKTELTTEQSNHLIELGIPEDWASLCEQAFDDGYRKNPIFTLDDLLKILPKEIELTDRIYNLDIVFWSNEVMGIYNIGAMFPIMIKKGNELIEVLYELTVWCLENNYLKFEQL